MKNKNFVLGIIVCILLVNLAVISAQPVSYCCERTNLEAWCVGGSESDCDPDYRSAPTSCESTSYCRLGTCINVKEGICMENSAEVTCNTGGGLWKEGGVDDLPQCALGCCLIGSQAAFVTQTRCKTLSSKYGLETNFRIDIQNEMQCIASATSDVKGACVFEKDYQKTCRFLTQKECQDMGIGSEDSSVEFHSGFLCSATELATNCGESTDTTCVEDKDKVYFLDSCGNLANVYDSSKGGENYDAEYWTYVIAPDCTVSDATRRNCGNCDYFEGSTCKAAGRLDNPTLGNNICKDLGCTYEKKEYKHGETWCANVKGVSTITSTEGKLSSPGEDLPGGRYFRLVCYNNEVTVEPCADFRQEICIQSKVSTFRTAACRVNKWQDCYSQDNERDCGNGDRRDCEWINVTESLLKDEQGEGLIEKDGELVPKEEFKDYGKAGASCVPRFAPGFNFWGEETEAESLCSLATTQCFAEYEIGLFEGGLDDEEKGKVSGDWKCLEKCRAECVWDDPLGICKEDCKNRCDVTCVNTEGGIRPEWKDDLNTLCRSLGDCGSSSNYRGHGGYYDEDDFITRTWEEEEGEGGGGLFG